MDTVLNDDWLSSFAIDAFAMYISFNVPTMFYMYSDACWLFLP